MFAYAVLIVCTMGNEECKPIVISDEMPLQACVMGLMPNAARYMGDNLPSWHIDRMMCVDTRRLQAFLGRTKA